MLTDKAKKLDAETTSFTHTNFAQESYRDSTDKQSGNVLPLERPQGNTGKLSARLRAVEMAQNGEKLAKPSPQIEGESAEIKSRMEAVLARMKSRSSQEETKEVTSELPPNSNSPEFASEGGTNTNKKGEELEQRRAAIIAIAREAEVRSREASDKFKQAETKLKEQTELRLQAEERVRQLEEESKQWMATAQAEELKRIEAEIAKVELEERLKQEETAKSQAERARLEAEQARKEAEEKLLAAEKNRKEAEAKADAVEQIRKEADARVQSAEEAARVAESLIYEADAIARQAEEKYKFAQANLQREAELRTLAEQMLKELANLGPHLEINWENIEAVLAQASLTSIPVSAGGNGELSQLHLQIEAEQKARLGAEQSRADAETKIQELEAKLRKAEEKYRTIENGYKKVLRKQEEELRTLSEQVTRNNEATTQLISGKSDDEVMFLDAGESAQTNVKIKFVLYGVMITLLLGSLVWIGYMAYKQS